MANNSSWKDEGSLNFVLDNPGYQKAQAKYNEEHGIQSSNEAGNIYLPAPYAVIVEPYEKGNKTNVSNSGDNYQKTLNAYNEAKRRLIDQTDEARDIKDTWSAAPRVTLENGNLMLNGTRKFLDSDTGKELQKTLKDMEGQTYNSEDLNKQIEAWNATLSKMADEYSKAADSLNIANAALADTARNAEYHKLTLGDLQKVSNSATIGKGADARTSKKKIFVGFDWDDDGNLIERWVEAKKFFEEFNSVNDDEKRRAYRDLIVQANNGDVGAYSKLMYLNGGAEGKPANVEYNAVGDFFHTLGEHLLVGLSEAADFVTTYVPIFNTSRLTGRVVRAAESGDINEFFAPDEIRKNIDSYKETLAWEDAYFSELTPGSTALAAQTGNVVGNFLGMAYSIWAGGVGNSAAATMVTQGINKANQALLMTGNFTAFERTAITGTQQALGGAVRTSASTSQFLMPTAIVENFPRLSSFLADKALSFSQYTGIGLTGTSTGDVLAGASRAATVTENTITMPGRTAGTLVARGTSAGNITATVVSGGTAMGSRTLGTLSGGALASEQVFAKGIQTAFRLAPLAGETVLRTTDQYFQKVYMGEDPGDMTEYIINNTAEALIWGGAFMAAGAKIRELKQIARAARQSPVSATAGGYSKADSSQSDWCGTRYNTPQEPQRLLTPGMELEKDIQDLVSSVVTVNGESFFVSPNRTAVATGYEGGEIVDGVMETTPTSIEFAPIPNSAGEAGAAFGTASSKKIVKYEVERTLSGADLVKTATDIETGVSTTTRQHFDSPDEAIAEAKKSSIPKTSPRTIANSDQVVDIKVAPISVDGVVPDVSPKGVSQIKVKPGVVYRSPDSIADELIDAAKQGGWSAADQDRLYREYERYVEEARSQQDNFIRPTEALNLPREVYGADVDGLLRLAAWAKANDYGAVPFKTPMTKKVSEPNNFLVTQYGVPYGWFSTPEQALQYASEMGERQVYEYAEDADALERPPVTVDNLKALQAGEPLLKLTAGGYPTDAIRRFNELMIALPTLESPEDYTRGVVDVVAQVQAIYGQVAVNVDMASVYENYARAIAEGRKPEATTIEKEAMRPLLQVFDALGHYFDPSGRSLTQEFYLPTMLKPNKKVSIIDALLGKDGVVDPDSPVDGGIDDILLDPTRIGNSGFWQQRSGDLFRDADGNFTMDRAAPLEDTIVAYTVSALTRGKNKLYVAAQNEVARSKFDRNRAQITSKQALAGLKDADTVRTKAKAIQAKISKDAEALAELKENYSGDEGVIDKAIEEKNYADELDYTRSVNTMAQKLGYNQFMQMNNIPGTVARFGANSTGFRGIANIRRKLEKINVTGTMWVERFGEKVNVGFGLEPTPSNQQIYGSFRPEKAINLGQLINMNFDSDRAAVVFLNQINEKISTWSEGDGWDLMAAISEFARVNFPLSDSEWYTAQLMKKLGQNYNSFHDPEEIFIANAEAISGWITRGTLDTFNKAIQMSNISNLDNRTIRALDEAAAYMLIGTPVKRSKVINYAQEAAVWSALGLNPRVAIGNMLNEPLRLIDVVGYRGFAKAWNTALNPKEAARINSIISDLPSRFDSPEMVGLAEKAKGTFGKLKEKAASVVLSPLEKSEQFKNILFWAAAEDNARARFPGDPKKQLQETLRFFNDYAIAGGKGTVPGVATASFGRTLNIFKTFTLRNFDDFIDYVQKVARGESGNNYWDSKYEKKHGGKNYKDKTGRNKFDPKIAARVIGGRVFRSYLFWLLVGSYFGKSFTDALGGDPSGITDGGFDRGLYDDPDTDEYEGMTDFDNFINSLPAGFILGFLQDVYFAARRRGVESKQFLGFDIMNDPRFTKSLESKLPLGVAKNRFADMLDLVDRGYSFSSTGRKTYAAPETAVDTIKGFLFGKATTQNSLAYGKYRYGMVDVWGDLSSGDWMDFAMNANPFSGNATFDTTRKDYTGVFNGSWNDVSTMQLIIQQFRERNKQIIADFQENKYRYRGEYEGLTDEEKLAKAKEQREKDIDAFTDDVTRAVDAFEKAGNTLNDNQITNIMYLFDFHEGEEDEEWNSSYARKRYVEAGLPDYNAAAIERGEKTVDGEKQEVTKGMLDRSLVLENAQQGFYGSSKEAANAVKTALKDFKSVYKEYNTRVKALNEKYFEARKKNKKSAETKQLNKDIEALQNEYLDRLYNQLSPVVEQYGTALIGTYDVADVLEEYMGNMIPYSSIKKYGQTYSSGNDIVYGQLTEWLQKRWGRNGPTAPSDKEVTSGIEEIRNLLDQGKTASARSKARAILEKIGRGSLGARRDDVETLRDYAYD